MGWVKGPWRHEPITRGDILTRDAIMSNEREIAYDVDSESAPLIAAAPDHALICWAMCVGAGRWEPFDNGQGGEFCMNGIRHSTRLDQFGCPIVTSGMRAAIEKARDQ